MFWDTSYFLLYLTCYLTNTMYPVESHLVRMPLLFSIMCLRLISQTRILNSSPCLNRSGDEASKWYKACYYYEVTPLERSGVTPLDLSGDRSIGNENYLTIATTNQEISVPPTGPEFQAYRAKNAPCNHWWRLPLYAEFILCTLSNYQQNSSFLIVLWYPLATTCTGISKVSWNVFLKFHKKFHMHSRQ